MRKKESKGKGAWVNEQSYSASVISFIVKNKLSVSLGLNRSPAQLSTEAIKQRKMKAANPAHCAYCASPQKAHLVIVPSISEIMILSSQFHR